MSLSGYFEDFGSAMTRAADQSGEAVVQLEDDLLKSFEEGYSAGWDDAVKAQSDAGAKITEDLRQALADFDFTLNEATGQFSAQIAPNLVEVFKKVLPEIAQNSLPYHILDELKPLISEHPDDHLKICVAPENVAQLQNLVQTNPDMKVDIEGDKMLGAGQANMRVATIEREIDLLELSNKIIGTVEALFQSLKDQ